MPEPYFSATTHHTKYPVTTPLRKRTRHTNSILLQLKMFPVLLPKMRLGLIPTHLARELCAGRGLTDGQSVAFRHPLPLQLSCHLRQLLQPPSEDPRIPVHIYSRDDRANMKRKTATYDIHLHIGDE
ncbi:hypothetical protein CEXT_709111 [Caerostris extrusa]|uniref:Uncharacterized protein n=1 Tax=Caerostris extrusa TaxID=172846 RepID=A0AAV4VXH6_CAEEX|nr:hypothetical protein CEXT_709111 [Caerostris extrusa]